MKNRSITKILVLNTLTLGFYEIIWLSETRQEMVSKYGVQIPSAKIVGAIYWFQWVAVLLALISLGIAIDQSNQLAAKPPIPQPSQECFIEYAKTNGPGALPANTLSSKCKATVDNYYAASDKRSSEEAKPFWYFGAFFVFVFIGLGSVFASVRWLKYYALGVEVVTSGRISRGRALQYLSSLPPFVRILLIQKAFNNSQMSTFTQTPAY